MRETDMLHLKINVIVDALKSKGLILDGELEIINKSLAETMKVSGHDEKEIEDYLFD